MGPPNGQRAIATSSVVVAAKDQVSSDLAGEAVILSLGSGKYYGVDGVATRVWELVREPIRVADIRDVLVRDYEVEPERCERDVLEFLSELAAHGLIEVVDGAKPR